MNNRVVIIGAGGHAKVVADIVRKSGDFVEGFLDDNEERTGEAFFGAHIIGTSREIERLSADCLFFSAIGSNKVRKHISESFDCRWYTAIHPTAVIGEGASVGEGSCVMANAVINPAASVGKHCIVNTSAIVEHDCKVGDFTHMSPKSSICGAGALGSLVWLGTGATVVNGVSVCDETVVGAGAVVVKNIEECGTYIGVPAKRIK